ncbi:MAG: RagB/SusD family nutrient uptake outer membrane protein, partial [Gemmatimonadota bacterium]
MRYYLSKCVPVLALAGTVLGTASCTDLTETVFTEITDANFSPTAADLVALVGPVYTPQRSLWMSWYGMVDHQSETADDLISPVRPNGWYDGGTYIRLHEHRWDANQGQPAGIWTQSYNGINAANRVIYQIESGVIPLDAATTTRTIAELRGMRAWYYRLLLDNFGRVPIVTDFTDTELPQQATRQQVYDFVVSELNAVIPDLPEESDGIMYGRLNRWAAKATLGRAYLNAEVYTGTPRWEEVIAEMDDIIDSGQFALEDDYR